MEKAGGKVGVKKGSGNQFSGALSVEVQATTRCFAASVLTS